MSADHKPLPVAHRKFAEAYAQSRNIVQAAMAVGFSRHIALSRGCEMIIDHRTGALIASYMRARGLAGDADEFEDEWGLIDDDEPETLFDRIAQAREQIALESRGGLPPPAELTFIRKPLSRRQRRATQRKDA